MYDSEYVVAASPSVVLGLLDEIESLRQQLAAMTAARDRALTTRREIMPPRKEDYEPIAYDAIPVGVKWKPSPPHVGPTRAFVSLFGARYRLERVLETGEVTYFERKGLDPDPVATPKDKIDAEPEKKGQTRYRVGAHCWFVGDGARWFLCEVLERGYRRITIKPVTGWDAERLVHWPHPEPFSFSSRIENDGDLARRLRPLKDRIV
jgi:hypothetical protein